MPLYGLGANILILPSSSEELCLGSQPSMSGLFAVNPALFKSNQENPYVCLNRGNWLGGVSVSQMGYNHKFRSAVTHFGIKYSALSDLEYRDEIPVDNAITTFNAYGLVLETGIAVDKNTYKAGINFSYLNFGIYTAKSSGLCIDFGSAIKLNNGIKIGLALKNLGIMGKLDSDNPKLPRKLLFGFSKELSHTQFSNTMYSSLEWNSNQIDSKFYFGNQFKWNMLSLLAGYFKSQNNSEASIGIGFTFNKYKIVYGRRFNNMDIGTPELLSFEVALP